MRRSPLPLVVLLLLTLAPLAGCLSFDDYDGDGIYDEDDPDDDNDGLPDKWENKHDLNPKNKTDAGDDPDGDSLTNLQEYKNGTDPNSDDTDGDLIPDEWEVRYGTDPTNSSSASVDTDSDGLTNLQEYLNSTLPKDPDSDDDGIYDGYEVRFGLEPLNAADASDDPDRDGLNNTLEFAAATDPKSPDTEGDGLPDGWEVNWGTNPHLDDADVDYDEDGWDADHDLELEEGELFTNVMEYLNGTDPFDDDTDDDGMGDGFEVLFGLEPLDGGDADDDPDEDGLSSLKEHMAGTSPVDDDTDGDGMGDGFELEWVLDPLSEADGGRDRDGDGLTNLEEYVAGTNLSDPDTDGDGVLDGSDVVPLVDIALRVHVTRIAFDNMTEGALDNPTVGKAYEIYLRVEVAGTVVWTEVTATLERDVDVDLWVTVNVPDDLRDITVTIALWENDTAESSGLNADDHLDVDGTGTGLDCDIVYDLIAAGWRGDTTTGSTDGHGDRLPRDPEHPDAVVEFDIQVGPA